MKASDIVHSARRNLALYPIQKVFNKRVFLPIIPIFYTEYVGFSIADLGVIASAYALINLLCNVPAGYFADKFGRVRALRIGAGMLTLSTVFYAGLPTKTGIIIGVVLESIGFAFMTGSGESLVHDSLEVLDRKADYSKVLSRAQSIALVVNAAIIALVPLSYAVDPRLPFVLGTIAFLALLLAAFGMRDVMEHETHPIRWKGILALERLAGNGIVFFAVLFFGIIGAIYFAFDIVTIALRTLGVSPEHLGWIFAIASLIGAGLGLIIHQLKSLTLAQYMSIDVGVLLLVYIAGFSGNVWLLIVAAILSISFWRYRRIIYQDHLLTRFRTGYKSTLISVMNAAESLNMLWVPIATTAAVGALGVSRGFGILGIATTLIGACYFMLMLRAFGSKQT